MLASMEATWMLTSGEVCYPFCLSDGGVAVTGWLVMCPAVKVSTTPIWSLNRQSDYTNRLECNHKINTASTRGAWQ